MNTSVKNVVRLFTPLKKVRNSALRNAGMEQYLLSMILSVNSVTVLLKVKGKPMTFVLDPVPGKVLIIPTLNGEKIFVKALLMVLITIDGKVVTG